jgi:D-serine deaminase-like pyridoxal phosphate-dependent protein
MGVNTEAGARDATEAAFQLPVGIETPALCIDLDRLQRNVERMAKASEGRNVALRPHAKTHKSVEVARRQIAAGAVGLTVATIGEAEVFAARGIEDIFIAYPIWAVGEKAARLRQIAQRVRLRVGADSVEGASLLGACLRGTGAQLFVELDSGDHRTGVGDPSSAVLVAAAARAAGLEVAGVFTHGGHSYAGSTAAQTAASDEVDSLTAAAAVLRAAGYEITECSAGSTPTALRAARGAVTEIRPGTYVYNDRLQLSLGACVEDQIALTVASTVVSHSGGRFVLDAGAKTLTKDLPDTLDGYGLLPLQPAARIARLYDHHAVVEPGEGPLPALGEVVSVVPNHVCPVVDLADEILVVRAGELVDVWPVDGRGRNR